MPTLNELIQAAELAPLESPPASPEITAITDNSRRVTPGSLFVAIRGTTVDAHRFLPNAAEFGAAAVVVERDYDGDLPDLPILRIRNTRRALGRLIQAFHGFPAREMLCCGVTGTNGKSTVAHLMESILRHGGKNPGLFGTIAIRYGDTQVPATHTTPDPIQLANYLSEMRDAGVDALSMEVSSHGIDQDRVAGIEFDCAILTNISHEHLDYHENLENYAAVKKRLFDEYLRGRGAINADDEVASQWLAELGDKALGFGESETADVRLLNAASTMQGTKIEIAYQDQSLSIHSPLRGEYNIWNLLAAAAGGLALKLDPDCIKAGLEAMATVPGRFEVIEEGQEFDVVVDYAHTPDALSRLLRHARTLARGRLVVLFGAGGDRDPSKRRPMGEAVGRHADWIVITNDNPRTEDPRKIADEVLKGVMATVSKQATVDMILDRREAIRAAIQEARPDDLVVLAGKGHEAYEMIGINVMPFDDRQVAREAIREFYGRSFV